MIIEANATRRLYFLMPHRFLQECIHSAGFHRIPQESAGFQWNGTRIQWNELGFHWILTEGACISACKYKCVYIDRLQKSVSVIVPFKVHTSLFWSNFPQCNDCISVPYLSNCIEIIMLFSWGKMQKGWKKLLMRNIFYLISPQWEHFRT